jgi:uncharacterized protein (TIGR03545 family)
MRRWFKWQWVAPRVAFLAVAVLGISYLLGVAARSAAMRWGEQVFGSPVNVRHARVPITSGCVELSGVTIGDQQTGAPCLEADFFELSISWKQLLSQQVIVDRGRVHGLRFADERGGSGERTARPLDPKASAAMFGDTSDELASTWLAKLDEHFDRDVAAQFESAKRTDAVCARWETEFAALRERAAALEKRAQELQQSADAAEANQLRHTDFMKDMPTQIAALRQEFESLGAEFEKLPQQLESERRAIVAARQQDERALRERMKFEPISQEAFTAYFLRTEVAASVKQLIGLMRDVRRFANAKEGIQQPPAVVIRNLEFRGTHRILNQDLDVIGLLTGFTTQPAANAAPMRLQLKSVDSMPLQVLATIDCTQPDPHGELYVDCRELPMPEVTLGRSEELRLKLAPSVASVTVSLRIDGNRLSGDVQLVRKQLRMTSIAGGELSDVPLGKPLQSALGDVNSLATHFTLQGTLDEPVCTLWSNLGPAVAEAMERAIERSGEEHANMVLAESRRAVDERLAAVERQVAEQQQRFAVTLGSLPQRLETLAREQTRRERNSVERLGRGLPDNSLFR